jgi:Flp pilus assembly protein TadG
MYRVLTEYCGQARSFLNKFGSDRGGAVAIMAGLMAIALVSSIAMAVDVARAYVIKSRISYAIDAAALAGGRDILSPTRDADIRMYFDANFDPGYLGATITTFDIVPDLDEETLSINVSADLPTTLGRVFGYDKLDIAAANEVKRGVRGMELALILDNTGSMRGTKMTTMKSASQDLMDILYGSEETVQNFWVSVVPYITAVNIGDTHASWLTGLNQSDFAPTTWMGCVEARDAPLDQNDTPPLTPATKFDPFFWETTDEHPDWEDNDWHTGAGGVRENISNYEARDARGPNLSCGPTVLPLTAGKTTVKNAIAGLDAYRGYGTMGNVGLSWGWRTVSPLWRGLWNGSAATLPLDYDTPFMDKVVIMLTDGQNRWSGGDSWGDAPNFPEGGHYTPFERTDPDFGNPGVTMTSATNELNGRLENTCTSMKAQGIIIYSITFQVSDIDTQRLYERCASSLDHFFNSPSNADLQVAFEQIGSELSELRLAQ